MEEKITIIKGEKYKQLPRITEGCWQLAPYKRMSDGMLFYFMNKMYLGRTQKGIMMNKEELKNLKKFMKARKIK